MLESLLNKFKNAEVAGQGNEIVLDADADIENEGLIKKSFGIRIYDGSIAPFVKIGDKYPNEGSYTFSTTEDRQEQITLEFHKSSQPVATSESYLGTLRIRGYKLCRAEEPLVRVHYRISDNRIVIWATNEAEETPVSFTLVKNKEGQIVH
ncbi:MAG: Hsp70 family protein [Desulfocapsaceae bacterium]|nr:Hsp70 family protein [Desulfocapsaceae bacterium]